MRTLRRLALILAVALLWDWSPVLPPEPVHTAAAQVGSGTGAIGSQLILQASRSSVIATNSVSADSPLWTNTLPVGVAYPMHLRLEGTITTNTGAQTANLTCAYQSSAGVLTPNASLALVSAGTLPQAASAPFTLDFWVRPTNIWPSNVLSGTGETVGGLVTIASQTNPTSILVASAPAISWGNYAAPANGSVSGMLDMASTTAPNIMCTWHWGTASTGNNLTIFNGYLMLGF